MESKTQFSTDPLQNMITPDYNSSSEKWILDETL